MTKSTVAVLNIRPLLEVVDVYFSSYSDPSTISIEVKNPSSIERDVVVKIYVDNYATSPPDAEITDTIPANSSKILTKNVSELNLTSGGHFVFGII